VSPFLIENACATLNIPLIVLPHRKPEYNGRVEKGSYTFHEELYNRTDLLKNSVRGIQEVS
jgi:hypothetical protein